MSTNIFFPAELDFDHSLADHYRTRRAESELYWVVGLKPLVCRFTVLLGPADGKNRAAMLTGVFI